MTVAVAAASTGCFTVQTAQREDLLPLRRTHDDHVALFGPKTGTRVDPTSPVRFGLADQGFTPWVLPERLLVNAAGVMLDTEPLPVDGLARITVSGVDEAGLEQLAAAAEALSVIRWPDRIEVSGPGPALGAWVDSLRPNLPGDGAAETWAFAYANPATVVRWSGADVRRQSALPRSLTDGLRWSDITSLEVEHPDYATVLVLLVAIPIGGALGANFSALRIPDRSAAVVAVNDAATLRKTGLEPPEPQDAVPLFSPLAKRRAAWRPFAATEFGTTFAGVASHWGVMGGLRVRDFFEVGLGLRLWWPNLFGRANYLSSEPLGPLTSKFAPVVYPTLRLGFNFDLDADRRLLVPLHLELGHNFRDSVQVRMAWGLQVRIVNGLFAALRPFTPQYTANPLGLANWQFPSTLEFGSTF